MAKKTNVCATEKFTLGTAEQSVGGIDLATMKVWPADGFWSALQEVVLLPGTSGFRVSVGVEVILIADILDESWNRKKGTSTNALQGRDEGHLLEAFHD